VVELLGREKLEFLRRRDKQLFVRLHTHYHGRNPTFWKTRSA